jgi:parallel beta-helix repeat protein
MNTLTLVFAGFGLLVGFLILKRRDPRWRVLSIAICLSLLATSCAQEPKEQNPVITVVGERATPLDTEQLEATLPPGQQGQSEATLPPAQQPAGSQIIAFTSLRDSTAYQANQEIYLMLPDGSQQVNLTNHWAWDDAPAWSADGKKIAFWSDRDGNPEIYVMDANGQNIQRLTNDPARDINPAWSPDGTRLAFVTDRNKHKEIFLMNADGSGQAPLALTDNPERPYDTFDFPTWSPDGSRIAFLAMYQGRPVGHIYLVNPDGSNEVMVKAAGALGRPALSPDGKQISYPGSIWGQDDPTPEIYIVNVDGSLSTRLAAPAMDLFPSWSADGKFIVFESDQAAELDYHHDLYRLSIQGPLEQADQSWLTRLTTSQGSSPAWSPTGVVVDLAALANVPPLELVPPLASTVCASGCDFSSIQAAIDAAEPGGTIEVRSGEYAEVIEINKSVTLQGVDSGGGLPLIRQVGEGDFITLTADRVTIQGFRMILAILYPFGSLVVKSNHNAIVGNTFEQCYVCILLQDANCNRIHQNTFSQAASGTAAATPSSGNQPPAPVGGEGAVGSPGAAGGLVAGGTPPPPGPAVAPAATSVPQISLESASYNQVTENSGSLLIIRIASQVTGESNIIDGVTVFDTSHHNLVVANTSMVSLSGLVYDNIAANNLGSVKIGPGAFLNTIARNQISLSPVGIEFMSVSELNLIANNVIDRNYIGIYVFSTGANLFYANQVTNSASYGIVLAGVFAGEALDGSVIDELQRPYLNVLYRNSLVGNQVDAYDDYRVDYWENLSAGMGEKYRNRWYSGQAGNFYDSYNEPAEGCQDANGDLLCDTGYPIPGGTAIDPYPWIQPPPP